MCVFLSFYQIFPSFKYKYRMTGFYLQRNSMGIYHITYIFPFRVYVVTLHKYTDQDLKQNI